MNVKRALFVLLMLALPWQTRWFSDAGLVAGYPWEQGRISVYVSWLILLAFAGVSLWQKRITWRKPKAIELVLVIGLLVPALFSSEPRASLSWLISVAFAALFTWVIRREQTSAHDLIFWFAVSLIPHALLGMFQFATQSGFDQKWLGLSALDPAIKGTAVILSDGVRYLRAYGGFPHPNIFGGYLAFALLALVVTWSSFTDRIKKFLFLLVPLLSMALGFTASRSAWLAFLLGLLVLRGVQTKLCLICRVPLKWFLLPFGLVLAVFPFLIRPVAVPVAGVVEEKSVNERIVALQQAPRLFALSPVLGMGQGAILPALIQQRLEPLLPHAVPVMIVLETGLVGLGALFAYLFAQLGAALKRGERMPEQRAQFWSFAAALVPILLLDHYLWSYWSGQVLAMIIYLLAVLDRSEEIR